MKSFLAASIGLGLLVAASGGAMACSFKSNTTAEAPMTPIVTADTATPSAPVATDKKAGDRG